MAFGNVQGQTHVNAQNIIGTLNPNQVPNLDASKITSGVFNQANIPALDASKVVSGVFHQNQIPNLDASKIQSGILSPAFGGTGVNSIESLKNMLGIVSGITISEDTISDNKGITIYQSTCLGISLHKYVTSGSSLQSGSFYSGFISFGALFLPYSYSGTIVSIGYTGLAGMNVNLANFRTNERNKTVSLSSADYDTVSVLIFNKAT